MEDVARYQEIEAGRDFPKQERGHPTAEAPEEAVFRGASRIEQFLAAGGAQDSRALAEMLLLRPICNPPALRCEADAVHRRATCSTGRRSTRGDRQAGYGNPTLRAIAHRLSEQTPQKDSIEADVAACLILTSSVIDRGSGVDSRREAP